MTAYLVRRVAQALLVVLLVTVVVFLMEHVLPGGPARATLFYVLNLYLKAFNYFHMGTASAMAWLLFICIVMLTWLNFTLGRRWVHVS